MHQGFVLLVFPGGDQLQVPTAVLAGMLAQRLKFSHDEVQGSTGISISVSTPIRPDTARTNGTQQCAAAAAAAAVSVCALL